MSDGDPLSGIPTGDTPKSRHLLSGCSSERELLTLPSGSPFACGSSDVDLRITPEPMGGISLIVKVSYQEEDRRMERNTHRHGGADR